MSTIPAIDWTQHGTTTPSRYRFVLSFVLYAETGTLELVNAPLEWKEIELLLKRDPETHGVHISAVVNTLTFIKEGKQLLEDLYAEKGLFSTCHLYIYYLDFTTREYLSMPSRYRLDFNTYRLVNLTRTTNGVQISCIEDDMVSKFQQRKNTVVDLNNLKGLSGFSITDYTGLLKNLAIPEINAYKTANFANTAENSFTQSTAGTWVNYLPFPMIGSDFIEAKPVVFASVSGATYDRTKGFFVENDTERDVVITGTVNLTINSIVGATSRMTISLLVLNIDNTVYATLDATAYTEADSGAKTITLNETYTLPVDKSIILVGIGLVGSEGGAAVDVDFQAATLLVSETMLTAPASTVQGFPVYEALERNLQIILDTQFPLYSIFFGRTDTPWNLTPDYYVAENQLRFASILSGLCIRSMSLTSEANSIPMKFMDLFKTLQSIWCIGGGFELVGTELRFRIEELAHFYQNTETLDLSTRINESEIEREQYSDLMFAKIKTGYSKFEYEAVMGRGEYNTTQTRTTVVPNDNEFNNTCSLRADTRGMLALLLKPSSTTGSEDVSGDEDVFIIKTQRGAVQDWDAETDENVVVENNTSLFQAGSLNLYLTPVRNLIRNGKIVNTGLALMPGTELTYQTSDKNNLLKTTGEGYTITETDAIATESLADPLWYPELLTIELPFYEADYIVLAASPLGYITLSENLSGWVMDVNWKFAQNSATLKLLRRIPV